MTNKSSDPKDVWFLTYDSEAICGFTDEDVANHVLALVSSDGENPDYYLEKTQLYTKPPKMLWSIDVYFSKDCAWCDPGGAWCVPYDNSPIVEFERMGERGTIRGLSKSDVEARAKTFVENYVAGITDESQHSSNRHNKSTCKFCKEDNNE